MATALPGFDAPAVGFEQPFEMLAACHERVRRSLALLQRLIEHIDAKGHDTQSRSAAADVLRYFDLAAPQHHLDEERHVFAVLAAAGDATLATAAAALRSDHARMDTLWAPLRVALQAWTLPGASGPVGAVVQQQALAFGQVYAAHLQTEEETVFPAARARMDAPRLAHMSYEMQARRRVDALA